MFFMIPPFIAAGNGGTQLPGFYQQISYGRTKKKQKMMQNKRQQKQLMSMSIFE